MTPHTDNSSPTPRFREASTSFRSLSRVLWEGLYVLDLEPSELS